MGERTIHSKYLFSDIELPANYHRPIIIADSLKTPENLGNIIRLAQNVHAQKVLFVDTDENIRMSKIKKTASSSFQSVNWEMCNYTDLKINIPDGYKLVAIETTSDSTNIHSLKLPSKVAFIVGNEVAGIRNELLDICYAIVHIPVFGTNTSLNVSHALAVSLFEWQRQLFE